MRRRKTAGTARVILVAACLCGFAGLAQAQSIDLGNVLPQAGASASGRIVQLVGLAVHRSERKDP